MLMLSFILESYEKILNYEVSLALNITKTYHFESQGFPFHVISKFEYIHTIVNNVKSFQNLLVIKNSYIFFYCKNLHEAMKSIFYS